MLRPVLAVAVSGGRDSTALLHITARWAKAAGVEVLALHVHHGLHPEADAWANHLRRQCSDWARRWPVRLRVWKIADSPAPGDSIEAWARARRYAALTQMAKEEGATAVLLAHHRRDQAETVLLQALRGGGPAGLAAMPKAVEREGLWWLRPWLHQPAQALDAYVQRWRLGHIHDDSNDNLRFDRNRLRHAVWPVLQQQFPGLEPALLQVAQHMHATRVVLDEVAHEDLQRVRTDTGLDLAAWVTLSPGRRSLVLRAWLRPLCPQGLGEHLLDRLLRELPNQHAGRWPLNAHQELRVYRGQLALHPAVERDIAAISPGPAQWVRLPQPGQYEVPGWPGRLELRPCGACEGIALAQLQQVWLAPRQGGEQFQLHRHGVARSLKKQFQACGVAAWHRHGPLLFVSPTQTQRPIFVPGLGLDAHACAYAGQPRVLVDWWHQPATHPPTSVQFTEEEVRDR